MIRFFCLNTFIAIHTILFCLVGILPATFDKSGRIMHFYIAVPWAKTILRVCGIKVRTKGLENVDPSVPRVYMINHQSYFDILATLACLPVDFKFIMKQELMRIPLLGIAMRRAGYIGIERGDPRKAVRSMNEAAARIKKGASVVIYPEGTRSVDGKIQEFKRGGFNLALKSGCDIVPVTISNSYLIVPKGSLKINKGSFDFHIGEPIPVNNYTRKNVIQLMDRVKEAMQARINQDACSRKNNERMTGDRLHARG